MAPTSHSVRFGIDATKLESSFPDIYFDGIESNFLLGRGKLNARCNRQLVNSFLESARMVLKPDAEIRIALCHGQGGMPADSLQEWRQSWLPALHAADQGLLLRRSEPCEPECDLSSHRGVDRPFFIGDFPQRYVFTFPNENPIEQDLQISCRGHELRVMLHPDLLEESPASRDDIVHGDAVLQLAQNIMPHGIRFETPVGEHSKSESIGNGPDGRKADVTYARTQEPPKVSHADIVKRLVKFKPLESERRAANAPLTFKK
jgi:hypothetical protein